MVLKLKHRVLDGKDLKNKTKMSVYKTVTQLNLLHENEFWAVTYIQTAKKALKHPANFYWQDYIYIQQMGIEAGEM